MFCDIAKFSDTIIFGQLSQEGGNDPKLKDWVGTQNLTDSADIILKESDRIFQAYWTLFWSGEYDWSWVSDFKAKLSNKMKDIKNLQNYEVKNFDDGFSRL